VKSNQEISLKMFAAWIWCHLVLPLDDDFSEPFTDALGDDRDDDRGVDRADDGLGGDIERDLGGETTGISGILTRRRSGLSWAAWRLLANCCKSCCCCNCSCWVWLYCCIRSCSCCSFCFLSSSSCWFWSRFCSSWISVCLFAKIKMKRGARRT